MLKESFNKENVTELFSQMVKILERDIKTPAVKDLIKGVKQLSSQVQEELKKSKNIKDKDDILYAKVKKIIKSRQLC